MSYVYIAKFHFVFGLLWWYLHIDVQLYFILRKFDYGFFILYWIFNHTQIAAAGNQFFKFNQ